MTRISHQRQKGAMRKNGPDLESGGRWTPCRRKRQFSQWTRRARDGSGSWDDGRKAFPVAVD